MGGSTGAGGGGAPGEEGSARAARVEGSARASGSQAAFRQDGCTGVLLPGGSRAQTVAGALEGSARASGSQAAFRQDGCTGVLLPGGSRSQAAAGAVEMRRSGWTRSSGGGSHLYPQWAQVRRIELQNCPGCLAGGDAAPCKRSHARFRECWQTVKSMGWRESSAGAEAGSGSVKGGCAAGWGVGGTEAIGSWRRSRVSAIVLQNGPGGHSRFAGGGAAP